MGSFCYSFLYIRYKKPINNKIRIISLSYNYLILFDYNIMDSNICFFCKACYGLSYLEHINNNIDHNQNVRRYYKQLIDSNYAKNNKLEYKK